MKTLSILMRKTSADLIERGYFGRNHRSISGVLLIALTILFSRAAWADRAVVIGISTYPNLPPPSQLKGCVNDAESMAKVLEEGEFKVTLLRGEEATRAGIIAALESIQQTIDKEERFVFFFAGHGTNRPKAGLLPVDYRPGSGNTILDKEELFKAVSTIPAASRTVILDSCFSGAISKSLAPKLPGLTYRYYAPPASGKSPVPANGQDTPPTPLNVDANRICYWTASMGNEKAMEADFDGVRRGVFSYHVLTVLPNALKVSKSWLDLHLSVKEKVEMSSEDFQHPTLSRTFHYRPVFTALEPVAMDPVPGVSNRTPSDPVKPTPAKPPSTPPARTSKSLTVRDLYLLDAADASLLSLMIEPNITEIPVEQRFTLKVNTKEDGYLLVFDRYRDERLYLIFPDPATETIQDAQMGKNRTTWEKKRLYGDAAGSDRLKAVLVENAEQAATVFALFKGKEETGIALNDPLLKTPLPGNRPTRPGSKRVRADSIILTSEITIEFVPSSP